jgi:hypothetical protein
MLLVESVDSNDLWDSVVDTVNMKAEEGHDEVLVRGQRNISKKVDADMDDLDISS